MKEKSYLEDRQQDRVYAELETRKADQDEQVRQ